MHKRTVEGSFDHRRRVKGLVLWTSEESLLAIDSLLQAICPWKPYKRSAGYKRPAHDLRSIENLQNVFSFKTLHLNLFHYPLK